MNRNEQKEYVKKIAKLSDVDLKHEHQNLLAQLKAFENEKMHKLPETQIKPSRPAARSCCFCHQPLEDADIQSRCLQCEKYDHDACIFKDPSDAQYVDYVCPMCDTNAFPDAPGYSKRPKNKTKKKGIKRNRVDDHEDEYIPEDISEEDTPLFTPPPPRKRAKRPRFEEDSSTESEISSDDEIGPFAHLPMEELVAKIVECEKQIQKENLRRELKPVLEKIQQDQASTPQLKERVQELEKALEAEKRARKQLRKDLKKAEDSKRDYEYAQEECEASRDVAMQNAARFAKENKTLTKRVKDLETSEKKLKNQVKKAEKKCKKLEKQRLCCVCKDDHASPMIRCSQCTLMTHIRCQKIDRDITKWICGDCMYDMEESEVSEKSEEEEDDKK